MNKTDKASAIMEFTLKEGSQTVSKSGGKICSIMAGNDKFIKKNKSG